MKKIWRKLSREGLLFDFILCGSIVLLGGGFLLYHILKIAHKPVLYAGDIRFVGICAAIFFLLVLLSGVSIYRTSVSYIRWYKGILDSLTMPAIVTDQDARWLHINEAARKMLNLKRDSDLGEMNSRNIINIKDGVMKKAAAHKGVKYRIIGSRIQNAGKNAGYLIILDDAYKPDVCDTRTGLIDEINRLLGHLGTATDQFNDCASTLAGCTVRQAGIINELTDVITGIASGEFTEPHSLNEKMHTVKMDMEQHVENSQVDLEAVKQTVKELSAARDHIDDALHNIDGE